MEHPVEWRWSSYPGYTLQRQQVDFVAYQPVWDAWAGEFGGKDPVRAFRRFVEAGLVEPPRNPLLDAWKGWLLESEKFLRTIKNKFKTPNQSDQVQHARRLDGIEPSDAIAAVAIYFGVELDAYGVRRSLAAGRDLAAYVAHRHTTATLRELAAPFGLNHPDSVSNLLCRAEAQIKRSQKHRKQLAEIVQKLTKIGGRE